MFGFKSKEIPKNQESKVDVVSMPTDFYGGANPVVQFKDVPKMVTREHEDITPTEKKLLDKQTKAGGDDKLHPVNLLSSRKNLIIGSVAVFGVAVIGASIYYYWQYKKIQSANFTPIPPTNTESPTPAGETTTAPEAIVPVLETTTAPIASSPVINLKLPSQFLVDSQDMDSDKVSDAAEEVFGTDPGNADTDKDGYPDGHEISYLYDPNGFAPKKLIDSGLVKDYSNSIFSYKMYYPKDWVLGEVDTAKQDVLFSTLSGESIEISIFDFALGETFNDWLAKNLPSEKLSDLSPFVSVFKVNGLIRKDGLVYYFYDQNRVYVLYYNSADAKTVNYRIVLTMMAESFRLQNSGSEVPNQLIEENVINTSSTSTTAL
ncbi:MAG: hypothetical protein PHW95_05560 [Patescibacteria group bacterium]|nr:hypothetical protein [Patescibacteria group bacterium]